MANIPTGVLRKLVEARDSLENRDASAKFPAPAGYYLIGIYKVGSRYEYQWIGAYEYSRLQVKEVGTTIPHLLRLLSTVAHYHKKEGEDYNREYFELYRVPERCPERS